MNALPRYLSIAAILLCGCRGHYDRLNEWTVLSSRSVDLGRPMVELARAVEGTAKTRGGAYMREAAEQALLKIPGGVVLVNVSIHENTIKNTLMVRGDVWGYKP